MRRPRSKPFAPRHILKPLGHGIGVLDEVSRLAQSSVSWNCSRGEIALCDPGAHFRQAKSVALICTSRRNVLSERLLPQKVAMLIGLSLEDEVHF